MARHKVKKTNVKVFFVSILCVVINSFLIYSLYNTWNEISSKKKEKEVLSNNLITLKEQEASLKVELNKLKDSSYVAKYAREKLFYSEKDEYIIKIK